MAKRKRTPVIPPMFTSDGCSGVPDYHYREQACREHDWDYRTGRVWRIVADGKLFWNMWKANVKWYVRECRERRWLNATIDMLVKWWWRPFVWFVGVRVFGWFAWRRHRMDS